MGGHAQHPQVSEARGSAQHPSSKNLRIYLTPTDAAAARGGQRPSPSHTETVSRRGSPNCSPHTGGSHIIGGEHCIRVGFMWRPCLILERGSWLEPWSQATIFFKRWPRPFAFLY